MANYSMRLVWDPEDEVYIAFCPELGDLSAHGTTPREAAGQLTMAMGLAMETYGQEGWALPEPRTARKYSGQFRVRLPESLHAWLADVAETEGVSLNTLLIAKLSEARGALAPSIQSRQPASSSFA